MAAFLATASASAMGACDATACSGCPERFRAAAFLLTSALLSSEVWYRYHRGKVLTASTITLRLFTLQPLLQSALVLSHCFCKSLRVALQALGGSILPNNTGSSGAEQPVTRCQRCGAPSSPLHSSCRRGAFGAHDQRARHREKPTRGAYERYLDAACEGEGGRPALIPVLLDRKRARRRRAQARQGPADEGSTSPARTPRGGRPRARASPRPVCWARRAWRPRRRAAARAAEQGVFARRAGLGRGPHRRHGELRGCHPALGDVRRGRRNVGKPAASWPARVYDPYETSCSARRKVRRLGRDCGQADAARRLRQRSATPSSTRARRRGCGL